MNHAAISDRYREMANEIRELIPLLLHSETIADLRLLAARYDKLAEFLKGPADILPHAHRERGEQAYVSNRH